MAALVAISFFNISYMRLLLCLCFLILIIPTRMISQQYLSKLLEFDEQPNSSRILQIGDDFLISSINLIGDERGTTLLTINEDFNVNKRSDFINVFATRDSPVKISNEYFMYCKDLINEGEKKLITLDSNLDSLSSVSVTSLYPDGEITSATKINNQVIGMVWDRYECSESCAEMNFKVFTTNGDVTNEFNHDKQEIYLFSFEVDTTSNQKLIVGSNSIGNDGNAHVMLLDIEGNLIWKHKSNDKQSRGNVPVWTEELSNGNIVYTDKVDRPNNFQLDLARYPNKLVWLSPNEDSLMHIMHEKPTNGRIEYNGLQKGTHGDYFFVYGYTEDGGFDDQYGQIRKFSNDGVLIWSRKYQHKGRETEYHSIRDIIELDNGDLVTLGISNFSKIWMMRINENGCFGENDCGEINIYTNTKDISPLKASKVSPNPTNDILNISVDDTKMVRGITVTSTEGKLLDEYLYIKSISLLGLDAGVYFVTIHFGDGTSEVHQVIKQ